MLFTIHKVLIYTQYYNRTTPMESIDMARDLQNIIKEGFLEKESRYFKSWRKRWFVLTNYTLYTFKERKVYTAPTQIIPLKTITKIRSHDEEKQFCFVIVSVIQKIDTSDRGYILGATSNVEKQQWIGQIGKAMVKLTNKEQQFE